MANLIFFDKDHTYQVDGETVPSVSEILRFISREEYETVSQYKLDNAADRGHRIHKGTENLDRYGSCEVTPDIEPYIRAYIQFLKDVKPEWHRIEHAVYHSILGYAGTMDRYGVIADKHAIVDVKSNYRILKPMVTAQLNGYALAAEDNDMPVDILYVLHLKPDGTYRLLEIGMDSSTFSACLTLHKALKKKSRKKKEETNGTVDDTACAAAE